MAKQQPLTNPISPLAGAGFFLRGLKGIWNPALFPYVAIPLLINLTLFASGTWWLADAFGGLMDKWLPEMPSWLAWLESLIWGLFGVVILVVVYYSFTLIANLVAAPFNSFLAEKAEYLLTGQKPAFEEPVAVQIRRAIGSELRKLLYILSRMIPMAIVSLILMFIPAVNAAVPVLWFLFSAWLLANEYLDYTLGNHGLMFPQVRDFSTARRAGALGFGGAVTLATSIPILNLFVMPAAVVGGTHFVVASRNNSSEQTSGQPAQALQ
ncbi:MAG: CysZ protein [Gammaproteobacteria bacterium]